MSSLDEDYSFLDIPPLEDRPVSRDDDSDNESSLLSDWNDDDASSLSALSDDEWSFSDFGDDDESSDDDDEDNEDDEDDGGPFDFLTSATTEVEAYAFLDRTSNTLGDEAAYDFLANASGNGSLGQFDFLGLNAVQEEENGGVLSRKRKRPDKVCKGFPSKYPCPHAATGRLVTWKGVMCKDCRVRLRAEMECCHILDLPFYQVELKKQERFEKRKKNLPQAKRRRAAATAKKASDLPKLVRVMKTTTAWKDYENACKRGAKDENGRRLDAERELAKHPELFGLGITDFNSAMVHDCAYALNMSILAAPVVSHCLTKARDIDLRVWKEYCTSSSSRGRLTEDVTVSVSICIDGVVRTRTKDKSGYERALVSNIDARNKQAIDNYYKYGLELYKVRDTITEVNEEESGLGKVHRIELGMNPVVTIKDVKRCVNEHMSAKNPFKQHLLHICEGKFKKLKIKKSRMEGLRVMLRNGLFSGKIGGSVRCYLAKTIVESSFGSSHFSYTFNRAMYDRVVRKAPSKKQFTIKFFASHLSGDGSASCHYGKTGQVGEYSNSMEIVIPDNDGICVLFREIMRYLFQFVSKEESPRRFDYVEVPVQKTQNGKGVVRFSINATYCTQAENLKRLKKVARVLESELDEDYFVTHKAESFKHLISM